MKKREVVEINNEKIYLRKGIFEYRVIHPVKDENGKIVWVNLLFGGWGNLAFLLMLLLLVSFAVYAYQRDIKVYREIVEDNCGHNKEANYPTGRGLTEFTYNFSAIKIANGT